MMCSRGQLNVVLAHVALCFALWTGPATAQQAQPQVRGAGPATPDAAPTPEPGAEAPAAGEEAEAQTPSAAEAQEALSPESVAQRVATMAMDLRTLPGRDEVRIANIAAELAKLGEHAVDPLLDLLTDPVSMAREAAVVALQQMDVERALPDLIARLGDEVPSVAMAAVGAVSANPGEWPTRALVRWLAHPDGEVADAVLSSLVVRDADVVRGIIETLYKTPPVDVGPGPYLAAMGRFPTRKTRKLLIKMLDNEDLAIDAIRGLAFFGPKAAGQVGNWIRKRSKTNPAIAAGAVAVLAGYGKAGDRAMRRVLPKLSYELKEQAVDAMLYEAPPSARPTTLGRLLAHRDEGLKKVALLRTSEVEGADPRVAMEKNIRFKSLEVRMLTARALQLLGRDPAVERLLITRYREVARNRTAENLGERALLLEGIGIAGQEEAVTELVQATGQPDEVPAALHGLGLVGDQAISSLLFVIKTGDPVRTPLAVEALAKAGPSALDPLMGLLVHPVRDVRNTARKAVAQIQMVEVVPTIVDLIRDVATPGRVQLVSLLGALYCEESYTVLREIARENADHSLRGAAVKVLAQMADPRVFAILKHVATNEANQNIRLDAVNGLIWQNDKASVPFLIGLLDYEKDFIRKAVARGLGYMASPSDIAAIEPNLSTPRPEIISAVRDAMKRVSFQPKRQLGDEFVEWAEEHLEAAKSLGELRGGEMTFADGTKMHYWLHGAGAPLLVLPDGPDFTHDYLRPALDSLTEDRLLVYVDLPGRGLSTGPADPMIPMGVEHDVQSTATLLARLNLRNVDVYGHGYGAIVAARLADKHPKLVGRMVFDNSPPPTLDGLRSRATVAASRVPEPWSQDLEWFRTEGARFNPEVYDRWLTLALMTGAVSRPQVLIRMWPYLKTSPTARRAVLKAMGEFDFTEIYHRIEKPTLMIFGANAPLDEAGIVWREGFDPGGAHHNDKIRTRIIGKAGHLPAYEQSEAWANALDDFLR